VSAWLFLGGSVVLVVLRLLGKMAKEQMLPGLSTRGNPIALKPVGQA
jgi:hypothetical protein